MKRLIAIALLLLSSAAYGQTTPLSNMTATFNDGGQVFNAIKMDIANTASAAGSTALWLGFSATPVFRVETDGAVLMGTVTTGVWNGTAVAIADGGTGQVTAQAAIDALTDVASATNEFVLTRDTATGNAIFKVAAGGGGDVTKVGTPVDNQVGVWTGDGTLEGDPGFTYAGNGNVTISGTEFTEFLIESTGINKEPAFALKNATQKWIFKINAGAFNDSFVIRDIDAAVERFAITTPSGLVGLSNVVPNAQLDINVNASIVGLNIDLDATPGDSLTITDSGSNVVFVVDGTGQVGVNEPLPEAFVEVTTTADADRFYQMTTSDDTKLWWEQETAGVNGDFTFQNDIGDVMRYSTTWQARYSQTRCP